jgi:hypothetical protein
MYCFIFATSEVYTTDAFYVRLTPGILSEKILLEPSGYYLTPNHLTIVRVRDKQGVFFPIQGGIPVFTIAMQIVPIMVTPPAASTSNSATIPSTKRRLTSFVHQPNDRNIPQFPLLSLPPDLAEKLNSLNNPKR